MHPILFEFGPITIYSYGFFVALGFLTALIIARIFAKKNDIDQQLISDMISTILVSALMGARVLYIIINFKYYQHNLIAMFKIWDGGLVFYGGFIFAVTGSYIFMKYKKMNLWKTADIISPGIALGHSIGRLGCFSAGCCYGKECSYPWD
jgi:phosphatidylglycerol:prolipoprotein diacylglycerol transferase